VRRRAGLNLVMAVSVQAIAVRRHVHRMMMVVTMMAVALHLKMSLSKLS
jgi:hypothetical protein